MVIVRGGAIVQSLPNGVPALRRSVRDAHLLSMFVVVVHRHYLSLLHELVEWPLIQVFNLVVVRILVLLKLVSVMMQLLRQCRHFCQLLLSILPCRVVALVDQDVHLLALLGSAHVLEGVHALVHFFFLVQRVQRPQRGQAHDGGDRRLGAVPLLPGGNLRLPVVVYGFSFLRDLVASALALDLEVLVRVQALCCEIGSSRCLTRRHIHGPWLLLLLEIPMRRRRDASLVKWLRTTMSCWS